MKLFSKITILAAFAVIAGYNVYKADASSIELSPIELANLEALATNETATPCGGPKSANGMCQSMNTVNCKDLYGCQ